MTKGNNRVDTAHIRAHTPMPFSASAGVTSVASRSRKKKSVYRRAIWPLTYDSHVTILVGFFEGFQIVSADWPDRVSGIATPYLQRNHRRYEVRASLAFADNAAEHLAKPLFQALFRLITGGILNYS